MSSTSILNALKRYKNVVAITKTKSHRKVFIDFCKDSGKKFRNIMIISFTKSYPALLSELSAAGVDTTNYFFIDCISARHTEVKSSDKCAYVSSPETLIEVSASLSRAMRNPTDLVILDDISSLSLYNDNVEVLKFLHGLMVKMQKSHAKGVYFLLDDGMKKETLSDLALFADKIVEA
jgi:hypothetical protein